jgi:hypothetical protein
MACQKCGNQYVTFLEEGEVDNGLCYDCNTTLELDHARDGIAMWEELDRECRDNQAVIPDDPDFVDPGHDPQAPR